LPLLASAVVMPPALAVTAGAVVGAPVALLVAVPVPAHAASAMTAAADATEPARARQHVRRASRRTVLRALANSDLVKAVTPRNRLVAQVSWHDG
jgi:hypothetical protein